MEPFEKSELTDGEVDDLLGRWAVPPAPARMRAAIFPRTSGGWWRRSVRVPLPVAASALLLLGAAGWRSFAPSGNPKPAPAPGSQALVTFHELQPVTELRPRIIRRGDARN